MARIRGKLKGVSRDNVQLITIDGDSVLLYRIDHRLNECELLTSVPFKGVRQTRESSDLIFRFDKSNPNLIEYRLEENFDNYKIIDCLKNFQPKSEISVIGCAGLLDCTQGDDGIVAFEDLNLHVVISKKREVANLEKRNAHISTGIVSGFLVDGNTLLYWKSVVSSDLKLTLWNFKNNDIKYVTLRIK